MCLALTHIQYFLYTRRIFSSTYARTSCCARSFSPALAYIFVYAGGIFPPHTHILPATLEKSISPLTQIPFFTLQKSCPPHPHILPAMLEFFFVCAHSQTRTLEASSFAHTHILPATRESSFLAHTQRRKNICFKENLLNPMECYNGSSKTPGFQGATLTWCNSNMT